MKGKGRPQLPPPRNLAARQMIVDEEEILVLEFPLPVPRRSAVLTEAEQAVALAAAGGLSTSDIAKLRRRSPRTIAHQLDAVYRKLGVKSRIELTRALARAEEEEGGAADS